MNRSKTLVATSLLLMVATYRAEAQSLPAFEVVSIKPIPEPTSQDIGTMNVHPTFDINETGVQIIDYPLFIILLRAFRLESPQMDAPDFAHHQFFNIQAKLPAGASPQQVPEMLRAMLAERFRLTFHREARKYPVNVLTVGKNGMKLPRLPEGTPTSVKRSSLPGGGRTTQIGTVTSLFGVMNSFGGLQLADETGLDGIYTWVQDTRSTSPDMDYQAALQESFKTMIEAAGLNLETRMVPKETIVIDHLEKMPTEN